MPGRSTPFELSAVDETGLPVLPRIPTAFWIIDRDLRITTAYGPGFDSLSLHPELDSVVGLDLFEYFKTDDPEFESIANHLIALTGKAVDCESKLRGRVAEVRLEPLRRHGEVDRRHRLRARRHRPSRARGAAGARAAGRFDGRARRRHRARLQQRPDGDLRVRPPRTQRGRAGQRGRGSSEAGDAMRASWARR